MPEGPELLFFSIFLKHKINGGQLTNIYSFTDKPIIIPNDFVGNILDIGCKGKLLWIKLSSKKPNANYLHIHYGITGWILLTDPGSNVKFQFTIKKANKEINLYLEDRRRFSKCYIYNELDHNIIINKLGIWIFSPEFTLEVFKAQLESKNKLLASLLLDQHVFSGIGNYIKNEVMFIGKLNVHCKSSELTDKQIRELYANICFVSYSNLIELLRDAKVEKYLPVENKKYMPAKLEIPYNYKIYGLSELKSGVKVKKIKVGGRDTYCTTNC